jgi:hypothetical protein
LTIDEEEAVFGHLDECGPIPESSSILAYLQEQGLLTGLDKPNGQGV